MIGQDELISPHCCNKECMRKETRICILILIMGDTKFSNFYFFAHNHKASPFIGKLLNSTLLWCLFSPFFLQFVILDSLSIFDLAQSREKALKGSLAQCTAL